MDTMADISLADYCTPGENLNERAIPQANRLSEQEQYN